MRGEITLELDQDDVCLEIPWQSDDNPSLCYVDLQQNPRACHLLPEVQAFPPLGRILEFLNHPHSPWRTAKCDVWVTDDLAVDECADFGLPWKMGSYIDLFFNQPSRCTNLEDHNRFAESLCRELQPFRARGQMEITLRRCFFHTPAQWGYALTLFLHAYGETPQEAEAEWSRILSALGSALERMLKMEDAAPTI